MALVLKDRVQETTTTTGTGTVTLAGAVSGFQSFSAIGNGNTCYYAIVGGTEWEVGLGTYTSSGTTLSRDTILESSNGGTAVNFSAGTKNVFVTYPAEKSIYQNASGVANLTSTDVTTALGYTPVTDARTLTINGTSYDLTANRTWSVGTVTSVTGTAPIASSGGATPAISISQATTSTDGYLSSTDWNTFNNKAPSVTYTSNYIPYGQGTTTPALSANFTYDGTSLNVISTNATGTIVVTDTGASGGNIKLVGNGGTTPNKTIRAQSGNFSIVNNAYTSEIFTLSDAGVISNSTWNGVTIGSGYGGTGFSTYATGDLIYASATNTLSKLAAGTDGYVLTLASGVPTWAAGGGGSMVYPSAGIAVSTGSAWGTSLTAPTGTIVGTTDTQTLTNKRVTPRVSTTTSSATPTINTDNVDMFGITALAVAITSFTTNLSGTPTDGQKLWIYIVGTATRAITWGASFEASTVSLPTTTVSTNRLDVGFVWNAATSKWRCVAVA